MDTEFINSIEEDHINAHTLKPQLWVELHADHLFKYAYRRINDEEVARDLVQETFLAALEKVSTFKGDSTERTWLTAIIKYKLIDLYRKKARTTNRIQQSANEDDFFDPDLNNWKKEHWPAPFGIEDQDPLNNNEFKQVLQQCLQKLPALWMSVFTMKHVDEEVTDTICKELRISSSNFWVIIHRAKVNLRSCLQKNWI
ncbi:sigma-70 family RNA polymerase sigma factor [Mucilaginibacter limnophilus]|uniref:Sigma-70 family RNA polymerase sigma factor n=1 Tax=Mucilaginibacter limnophilus TaxID=1932778 RepID=A0A3S2V0B9_9SPHI|nr:sigma-70 family RNA polymerase sigma factor [Mucilaginibacter limnophilus]RVT98492.1 sigma-70 family RNA polymerase sigma factor [Mucilaginibacter limnophilus]